MSIAIAKQSPLNPPFTQGGHCINLRLRRITFTATRTMGANFTKAAPCMAFISQRAAFQAARYFTRGRCTRTSRDVWAFPFYSPFCDKLSNVSAVCLPYNVGMRVRIKAKNILVYAIYAVGVICINYSAGGAPLSLGLCFAMLACGANLFATPIIYVLAYIPSLNWITMLIALFEGAFLCAITAIYRRAHRRIKYEYIAFVAVALAPFIAFSPWNGLDSLYFTDNEYAIRAVAAAAAMVFSLFCLKGVYALFFRLCRCKLRSEEIVCLALMFTVAGIGLYNLCGLVACLCLGAGLIVFCARMYRDPAVLAVACVAGLPLACTTFSGEYIAAFTVLAAVCLLFTGAGRAAPSAAAIACGALYLYFKGAFTSGVGNAVLYAILLFMCCALPALPPDDALEELLSKLRVKKVIPEIIEDRLRSHTSEKLFATSQVFREIESAFNSIDETPGDEAMKKRVLGEIKMRLCAQCERANICELSDVYDGFARLLHSGCIKGRVNLVDLPAEVTANCVHPSEVMNEMNNALAQLKRLSAEAENAQSGRRLLANQAKGICEVLKSAAVDIARGGIRYEEREKRVENTLAGAGIYCTEVKISGEDGGEIYLTVAGKVKAAALKNGLKEALGRQYALKDKIAYDEDRTCYIFVRPPDYDAAFGVAFAVKDGERASGDTHSVIKINEHRFLMALCDGMGSGEEAKKVSTTTISLIEAFYRAEMPSSTILETINKLMSFNRDESFTCIDIAAIDLNTLKAGFIKIGSPASLIIKKDGIKVFESTSLPLGILESIHPTVCEEQLEGDDIVVFMSDGITSSFPSATDLYAFIEKLKPLNPQNLADEILAGAKKAARGRAVDDMTVLCVRIFAHAN